MKTTYEYYEVGGKSAVVMRRTMNRHGVRWTDGKTYDAVTRWHVNWTFEYAETDGGCTVTNVRTHVDVVIRLPRWTGRADASPALRDRWDSYISALHRHELGHRQFGMRAAEEIAEALTRMEPTTNCGGLETEVNALGHEILEKYRREEIAYDRNTRHGFTNPEAGAYGMDALAYNPDSDRRSWEYMTYFFKEIFP